MIDTLRYKAAKYGFGKLDAHEIRSLIEPLIAEGIWFDDFLDALDSSPPQMTEVLPSFLKVLDQYGIAIPDREAAVWELIRHHVNKIAIGVTDPLEGLKLLIADVYWDYDFHTPTTKYLGDSHGIEKLVGLYWEYDDMRDEQYEVASARCFGENELKLAITSEAKRWLAAYPLTINSTWAPSGAGQ